MTIGIAAHGPSAGLAVLRALAAVEKVASGAIGGYAVFAAIDAARVVHRAQTQRGGTSTLFVDGETTGVAPPDPMATAPIAGVMSSGPDRPTPLSQFLPAEPNAGLITGHRLPNAAGASGRPLNIEILKRLKAGLTARGAVDAVLDANPEADAGVIAVDAQGQVYARNSARVCRRPDLGHARRDDAETGATVEVLHNAIYPVGAVAALAAEIAMDTMVHRQRVDGFITVSAGVPLAHGDNNRVIVDATGKALRIETTDRRILQGRHNCAAIYIATLVMLDGRILGRTVFEPNVLVEGGRIVSMSGQTDVRIGYRMDT